MEEFSIIAIQALQGTVVFKNYDEILKQAEALNEQLTTVVVTEDTIQTNKKLVASVRKRVNELEQERVRLKKLLLEPYDRFAEQVKTISNTVAEGERIIRNQINEYEECLREQKYDQLVEIFNKRRVKYPQIYRLELNINDFIKPNHLNKSVSIDKVEQEMVDWFTHIEQEISTIHSMEHSNEILLEYLKSFNLSDSINRVNERKKSLKNLDTITPGEQLYTIKVFRKVDYQAIINFAKENNIELKGE